MIHYKIFSKKMWGRRLVSTPSVEKLIRERLFLRKLMLIVNTFTDLLKKRKHLTLKFCFRHIYVFYLMLA